MASQGQGVTALCRRRDSCRLCGAKELDQVLSLVPTPAANAFLRADDLGGSEPVFPLDLHLCRGCGHTQLLDVVDPDYLFKDYVYVSGTSPVFVEHFRKYAEEMVRVHLGAVSGKYRPLVVDIGSNDGTLLKFFKEAGYRVIGVDPAREIAIRTAEIGVPTVVEFFKPEIAEWVKARFGPAELVTANNVFAHVDDLGEFVEGVKVLLSPTGLFVLEVSYLGDMIEKTLFDLVYHEHLSYHAVTPLARFFHDRGLELSNVERVDTHGGSVRCFVRRIGHSRGIDDSVQRTMVEEMIAGLGTPDTFRMFGERIEGLKRRFNDLLVASPHPIVGYGAPGKSTTLLHQFGVTEKDIDFIVDDNPRKWNLYTPGTHIPILHPARLYERDVGSVVIFAWNFADSVIERFKPFLERGVRFIVPMPEPVVVA